MLLYDWEQFVNVLLYLLVTYETWSFCDIFNAVSCLYFLGTDFLAVSTCIDACFLEESINYFPTFNLGFRSLLSSKWAMASKGLIVWIKKPLIFDLWSNSKKREILRVIYTFKWFFYCSFIYFVIMKNRDYFAVVLCLFQLLVWSKY